MWAGRIGGEGKTYIEKSPSPDGDEVGDKNDHCGGHSGGRISWKSREGA